MKIAIKREQRQAVLGYVERKQFGAKLNTTKLFFMAALALMTTACSNDDNDIQNPDQPAKAEGITITAKLAPKSGGAATRAVSDGTDKIVAEWAADEHIAILYTVGSEKKVADAKITGVDGNKAAIITFTVDGNTTDGTACQIVYPLSAAKNDNSGVKAYADMLATQDGVLDGDLDVRVGAGTIQTTTPSLSVTTQPAAQYSIFKFTLQNLSSEAKSASEFKVSDGSGKVITTVTPGSASGELFVALPALATGTYWFNATVSSQPYIAKATVSTATSAGTYYQSTVQMATVGDVIKADGKFYAAGTEGAAAVIAYVGSVDKYFTKFLAIALEDADANVQNWTNALAKVGTYAAAHPITIGGTIYSTSTTGAACYDQVANDQSTSSATATAAQAGWRLPSVTDFRYIFAGLGGLASPTPTSPVGISTSLVYGNAATLQTAINTACGNSGWLSGYYWSSSEYSSITSYAWAYNNWGLYSSQFGWPSKNDSYYVRAVFAY